MDFDVTYTCLRYDAETLDPKQHDVHVIDVPQGLDIRATEAEVSAATLTRWLDRRPDVIVVGGWPFFELAARAPAVGVPSVFIDAGAVPHDELHAQGLWPQLEVQTCAKVISSFCNQNIAYQRIYSLHSDGA